MPNITIQLTEEQAEICLRKFAGISELSSAEDQIRAQLTPSLTYDRQTCLQGLYNPATNPGMPYWGIDDKGNEYENCSAKTKDFTYYDNRIKRGWTFFPNIELRSEFRTIAEGKWLPKKWDKFYSISGDRPTAGYDIANFDLTENRGKHIYFPSLPQMESFVASRKKEEPKESICELIELRDRKPNLLNDILLRLLDEIEQLSARIGKMEEGKS